MNSKQLFRSAARLVRVANNMKKIIVFALCATLVVLFLVRDIFTFTVTKDIVVSRSIYDVAGQFTDLKNWPNWHPDAKGKDASIFLFSNNTVKADGFFSIGTDHRFTITASNAAAIVLKEEKNGDTIYQTLYAEPDSMGRASRIYWKKYLKTTDWIKEQFSGKHSMQKGMEALKQTTQDPQRFYGFVIEIKPVADTLVLTREMVVETSDVTAQSRKMYNELDQYARSNKLTDKTYGYRTYKEINNHKTLLAVGIPVNKRTAGISGARFLELPALGRFLVGDYKGPYAGIKNLYVAMEKYISDHNLKRVADPLEKIDHAIQSPGDSTLKTAVNIPIY